MPTSTPREEIPYSFLGGVWKDLLRDLSAKGYIYIGRNGFGFTYKLLAEMRKHGTIQVLSSLKGMVQPLQGELLEYCMREGGKFANYADMVSQLAQEVVTELEGRKNGGT